jgi:TP901 family phage tail tape measure protein
MADKVLHFDILARDLASKTFNDVGNASERTHKKLNLLAATLGGGIVAATVSAVKSAANYQQSLTSLVTGAGESEKNIKLVGDGMLRMAGQVGIGAQELSKGMYLIESAGYHGAAGLTVLKAAAEGARVGAADMKTVADGLTTAMVDYKIPTQQAAAVTSKLVATVAAGKTTMGDLAGSLHNVLPAAAAAHIGLAQVLGAMATMTGQGISAEQATQDLANTIRALQAPSSVATKAMAAIGLSSLDVSKDLGKNGLTGTFDILTQAITKHMGPSGLVIESAFNKSKIAAASAREMLDHLPASLRKLGEEFLANQITQKEWAKALKGQDVLTSNLGKEFAFTAKTAHGFAETLRAGGGSSKTFAAVLSEVTGGATGLNTALALTGGNASTFGDNVKKIGAAAADSSGHVKGFAATQKDLNTKIANAKAAFSSLAIQVGQKLLPALTETAVWIDKHRTLVRDLAVAVGALVVSIYAWKAAQIALSVITAVSNAIQVIAITRTEGLSLAQAQAALTGGALTGVMAALNAVMDANPVGLIVIGIAALAAGLIYAYTHSKTFRDIVQSAFHAVGVAVDFVREHIKLFALGAALLLGGPLLAAIVLVAEHFGAVKKAVASAIGWIVDNWKHLFLTITGPIGKATLAIAGHFDAIKHVVSVAIGFITDHWKLLLIILAGPIGLAVVLIVSHFDAIKHAISAAVGFIKDTWKAVLSILTGPFNLAVLSITKTKDVIVGLVKLLKTKIGSALSGLASLLTHPFDVAFQFIEAGWNKIKGIVEKIGGAVGKIGSVIGKVGGAANHVGGFLGFATGGRPPVGVASWVGERGKELFVPDGAGTVIPHDASMRLAGGSKGLSFRDIHVVSAPNEPAAESVPRALRNLAFTMGLT